MAPADWPAHYTWQPTNLVAATHDSHHGGVSPETGDVVLDPVESHQLVPQPHVAPHLLGAEGQEAQSAESGGRGGRGLVAHLYLTVTTTTSCDR